MFSHLFRSQIKVSIVKAVCFSSILSITALSACAQQIALPPAIEFPADIPENTLQTLHPVHPRIMANAEDFAAIRKIAAENADVATMVKSIRESADGLLKRGPREYTGADKGRMLSTSRWVRGYVMTLGMAYQMTGDKRYADRIWVELENAAKFPDWNPPHFLDTAEMTYAFAVGYDWAYDAWTPEQRTFIRRTMVEKGLNAGLENYRRGAWWIKATNNWNQVCNGGMILGALAVADEEPAVANEIIRHALVSLPYSMREYAPDGGWNEGPSYWILSTHFVASLLSALDKSLATDFGLSKFPGFSETGNFPLALNGPLGKMFNFADSSETWSSSSPQLFWFASQFDKPGQAAFQIPAAKKRTHPLDILWGARWVQSQPAPSNPLVAYYTRANVVTMRSNESDPDATFVGFKGGDNAANHSHLDLGSFVLDALGERWAVDLGGDSYELPGYFREQRWTYFRMRAESHNTLVINPSALPDQNPKAKAPIVQFGDKPGASFAVADLSNAYDAHKIKAQRGVRLLGTQVLVQDEISAPAPANAWWFMHTRAAIEVNGSTATLRLNDKTMTARILSPASATFQVMAAGPLPSSPNPEGQQKNADIRKLAIHLPDVSETRITVLLTPGAAIPRQPEVESLRDWK
ncbi:MAG: heparinase II/III family protein [Armatimonadetes bacterium]|nr:heparinase II/III family protein [Armatimonadota bacterium]